MSSRGFHPISKVFGDVLDAGSQVRGGVVGRCRDELQTKREDFSFGEGEGLVREFNDSLSSGGGAGFGGGCGGGERTVEGGSGEVVVQKLVVGVEEGGLLLQVKSVEFLLVCGEMLTMSKAGLLSVEL